MPLEWNDGTKTTIMDAYKEFGQWARHYSTVRLTIGTFFITLSFGTVQFRWDRPDLTVAVLGLSVFLIGMLLFLFFSNLTFKRMRQQIEMLNLYRAKEITDPATGAVLKPREAAFNTDKLSVWRAPDGVYAAVAVLLLYLCYVLFWIWPQLTGDLNTGRSAQMTVPVQVKIGDAKAVTFNLPLPSKEPLPEARFGDETK